MISSSEPSAGYTVKLPLFLSPLPKRTFISVIVLSKLLEEPRSHVSCFHQARQREFSSIAEPQELARHPPETNVQPPGADDGSREMFFFSLWWCECWWSCAQRSGPCFVKPQKSNAKHFPSANKTRDIRSTMGVLRRTAATAA